MSKPLLFHWGGSQLSGNFLCASGVILMAAAFLPLRKVIQVAPEPREDGYLVTSGVYHWLRHPIYTSILMIVIGLFLKKPTFGVAAAAVAVIVFLFINTRFEERLLNARYSGNAEYRKHTWGLIPGLRD